MLQYNVFFVVFFPDFPHNHLLPNTKAEEQISESSVTFYISKQMVVIFKTSYTHSLGQIFPTLVLISFLHCVFYLFLCFKILNSDECSSVKAC